MKDILFDLDGTITDPALGITNSVKHALNYYGIEESYENLLKFIGPPLLTSFQEFYGFDEAKANEAIEKYREYFSVKGLFENKVYPGMEDFLKTLKDQGYRLSIATSKPEKFAKEIIEYFHLDIYFDHIFGATMDGTISKKHDVIAYALNELNTKDAIMVGDRRFDIEGGHINNLKAIGVLYGYGNLEELQEAKAEYIVENVDELLQAILTI